MFSIKDNNFKIKFWGVRGSCSVWNKEKIKFGVNTSCVQVQINDELIIFDGGTGICELGRCLRKTKDYINGNIFITHAHWDHIQGLPYFLPALNKKSEINIYGEKKENMSFEEILKGLMKYPYFPLNWNDMKGQIHIKEIETNEEIVIKEGIIVKTIKLNHPNGCIGYKVEHNSVSFSYIVDVEHTDTMDKELIDFIKNTNVFVYDTNYTNEEYEQRKGWGHSTWQKAVELAKEANVEKLILYHHDIFRTDEEIEEIEMKAQNKFKETIAAKEGMEIYL